MPTKIEIENAVYNPKSPRALLSFKDIRNDANSAEYLDLKNSYKSCITTIPKNCVLDYTAGVRNLFLREQHFLPKPQKIAEQSSGTDVMDTQV